jgi:outer membrane protein OmpA-like peptidoglycan-associated protein
MDEHDKAAGRKRRFLSLSSVALVLAIVIALTVSVDTEENGEHALIVATPDDASRARAQTILESCESSIRATSPNGGLQLWVGSTDVLENCLRDNASSPQLNAAPWVNWLCRSAQRPVQRWGCTVGRRDASDALICPDAHAQFTYLTAKALPDAQMAPPSDPRVPVVSGRERIWVLNPLIKAEQEAVVRHVSVIEGGGYQVWFDLLDGGGSGYHTVQDEVRTGRLWIGSQSFYLELADPSIETKTYRWQPTNPEADGQLHSADAPAGANVDTVMNSDFQDFYKDYRVAKSLKSLGAGAEGLVENDQGNAYRDSNGAFHQITCLVDPPSVPPESKPATLHVLFAYTSEARRELAAGRGDSDARAEIMSEIDGVIGDLNLTLQEQSVPFRVARADITPVPNLDEPVGELDRSLDVAGMKNADGDPLRWLAVATRDILSLQKACSDIKKPCKARDAILTERLGASMSVRRRILEAIKPVLVDERRYSGADVVAFIVGRSQMDGLGEAGDIRAKNYTSYIFLTPNGLLENFTLQHEIGHLLGARHELLLTEQKEKRCKQDSCKKLEDKNRECQFERGSCPGECLMDSIDRCEGAPLDNHAFEFSARLIIGNPRSSDVEVRAGTIMTSFSRRLSEIDRDLRVDRWSARQVNGPSTWNTSDFASPTPVNLSEPGDFSSEHSNERRVVGSYASCAAGFLPSPLDSADLARIDEPNVKEPTLAGFFDEPLPDTSAADKGGERTEVRDPQRTIYFETDLPTEPAPALTREQAWTVREVLYSLSPNMDGSRDSDSRQVFYIEGYADRTNSEEHNCALAWRRAHATATSVCRRAPGARVGVVAYGENWPTIPTKDEVPEQRNRRAVISWPTPPLAASGKEIEVEECSEYLKRSTSGRDVCD